jgi:hypothetical protein
MGSTSERAWCEAVHPPQCCYGGRDVRLRADLFHTTCIFWFTERTDLQNRMDFGAMNCAIGAPSIARQVSTL